MLLNTRYIFFGTPDFAAVILEKLIKSGFPPSVVVCNPDRPVGRKKIITPPPVKRCIQQQVSSIRDKIKILQPENIKEMLNTKYLLLDTNPDFFVVAAYAKIIPKEILEIPRLGTIGVHPSLLPKYRGSSPIQSAILSGESETGVTLFLADEKVDHGPILTQRKLEFSISNFQFSKLQQALAELGGDLLIETLSKFLKGEITPLPQEESRATYTKKFKTEDAYIDPLELAEAMEKGGESAIKINRKILALNPEPGAWTMKDDKRMKILAAGLTFENKLKLKTIQLEGRNPTEVN